MIEKIEGKDDREKAVVMKGSRKVWQTCFCSTWFLGLPVVEPFTDFENHFKRVKAVEVKK